MSGSDLFTGTLDMLILRSLSEGPRHGYAIGKWIRSTSGDVLKVEEGALYPALQRLRRKGWVESEWGRTDTNRKAKFYRLTPLGEATLADEAHRWNRYSDAVSAVMRAPGT